MPPLGELLHTRETTSFSYSDRELELAQTALRILSWNEKGDPQDAIRKSGAAIAFKVRELSERSTSDQGKINGYIDLACFMLGITVPVGEINKRLEESERFIEGPRIPVFNGMQGQVRFPNTYGEVRLHLQGIVDRHVPPSPKK